MPAHAIVWLVIGVALVVVLALSGAQVARALREMNRLSDRVDTLADAPVLKKLDRAESDLRRIEVAAAQATPLAERAKAAVTVIRRGPIPPELLDAVRFIRAEIAEFRRFARR
jgi:hypothetical protein